MTGPKVNEDTVNKYRGGKILDALVDREDENAPIFRIQSEALAVFGMKDLFSERGSYRRGNLLVCFHTMNHDKYGNFMGKNEDYILEYYDHTDEIEKGERTNRVIFLKEKEEKIPYRFLGEYQAVSVFPLEEKPVTLWLRINTQMKSLI